MNRVAHIPFLPAGDETSLKKKPNSMLPPIICCIALATGGASDAAATFSTGHSLLAETGLPMEAQLGLSLLFLVGFCYAAKLVLAYHRERVDELKAEKAELIKRLREIQDAKDKRLIELENEK